MFALQLAAQAQRARAALAGDAGRALAGPCNAASDRYGLLGDRLGEFDGVIETVGARVGRSRGERQRSRSGDRAERGEAGEKGGHGGDPCLLRFTQPELSSLQLSFK